MKRVTSTSIVLFAFLLIGLIGLFMGPRASAADEGEKKSTATFEVYKDKAGDFRWRLRAQNTNVIASSGQGYSSKQACLDGIESVKKSAADAPVKEAGEEAEKP
jgi:uncharacterized protein YegP (UPF0339 family)